MRNKLSRGDFLKICGRSVGFLALGGVGGGLAFRTLARGSAEGSVWQIDPSKCIQCGQCATDCVQKVSAVKCFHEYRMCGYCELCTGFFEPQPNALTEAAENQICPSYALKRRFVEEPYFEYVVDEERCMACGRCVKGCVQFGNGSLYLQVRHDLCLNCNQCNIASNCPAEAFVRRPASDPYIPRLKKKEA